MVAVAASPTPGAAAATRSHDHPPYKDMVLSALHSLKGTKPTSRQAISKYISTNYPNLPPSHSSLLSHHLRRLHSKGLIRMLKHSYMLADAPESKKRGRPRKTREGDAKTPDVGVYILPQAEQLKTGFLRSLPGAVAIVLPEGILSRKTAKSPVLILPNGVRSLVDVSGGGKKLGRPRKKVGEGELGEKREVGRARRKLMLPKQVLIGNGESVSVGGRKVGRPRKVRENGDLEAGKVLENVVVPEVKKRVVGRPKKVVVVEAPKALLGNDIAS